MKKIKLTVKIDNIKKTFYFKTFNKLEKFENDMKDKKINVKVKSFSIISKGSHAKMYNLDTSCDAYDEMRDNELAFN